MYEVSHLNLYSKPSDLYIISNIFVVLYNLDFIIIIFKVYINFQSQKFIKSMIKHFAITLF